MKKVENVKIIGPNTPEAVAKEYLAWMVETCEYREKNVALKPLPLNADIISRAFMPVAKGEVCLAIFYYDYLLQNQEKGGASHHPDEGAGASMVGPDAPRGGRRR
jgi:hypothetical protein